MSKKTKMILMGLAGFGQVAAGWLIDHGISDWNQLSELPTFAGLVLVLSGALTVWLSDSPKETRFVDGLNNRRM